VGSGGYLRSHQGEKLIDFTPAPFDYQLSPLPSFCLFPLPQHFPLPAAMLPAVVPGDRLALRPSHISLFPSVTSLSTKDCRVARRPLAWNRMSDDLPGFSDRYPVATGFEHPRLVF